MPLVNKKRVKWSPLDKLFPYKYNVSLIIFYYCVPVMKILDLKVGNYSDSFIDNNFHNTVFMRWI